MFDHALLGLARIGQHAMAALTWILLLIALALATWTSVASSRAQEPAFSDLSGPGQPDLSNQNVSGR